MTIDLDELERLAVDAARTGGYAIVDYVAAVSPDVVRELIARVRAAESERGAAIERGVRAGLEAAADQLDEWGASIFAREIRGLDVDAIAREVKP